MLSSSPGKEGESTLLKATDSMLDARECPGRVRSESESLAEIPVSRSDLDSCSRESTDTKRRIQSAGPRLEMVKSVEDCNPSDDAFPDSFASPSVTPLVSPVHSEGSGPSTSDVKARRLVVVRSEAKPLQGLNLKSSLSPNLRFQCLNSLLQQSSAESHESSETTEGPLSSPSPSSGERILVLDPVVGPPAKEKIFQLVEECTCQPRIVSVKREECMKKEHASIFVLKDAATKQHRGVTVSRSHTWNLHDKDVTGREGLGHRRRLPVARNTSMVDKDSSVAQGKGAFSDDEVIISATEEAFESIDGESRAETVSQQDSKLGAREELPKGRSKSMERPERDVPRWILRSNSVRVGPMRKTESPRNVSWLDVEPDSE